MDERFAPQRSKLIQLQDHDKTKPVLIFSTVSSPPKTIDISFKPQNPTMVISLCPPMCVFFFYVYKLQNPTMVLEHFKYRWFFGGFYCRLASFEDTMTKNEKARKTS